MVMCLKIARKKMIIGFLIKHKRNASFPNLSDQHFLTCVRPEEEVVPASLP